MRTIPEPNLLMTFHQLSLCFELKCGNLEMFAMQFERKLIPCLYAVLIPFFLLIAQGANAQISGRDVQIGTNPMRWQILVRNDHHYTVTLQYSFSNLLNASLTTPGGEVLVGATNYYVVIASKTEVPVFNIGPAGPGAWTWNWSTGSAKGNALLPETIDSEHIYRLPYETGNFSVGWSYKSYTPYGQPPDYWHWAIDWAMPEWTPLVAARGGNVATVVESNSGNGNASEGNFIEIEHSDGTFAAYIHLVQNGSVVNEGDIVVEGQLIGYSGNTGASSGPHLHFHVWRTYVTQTGFVGVQLPIRFFAENCWGFFPRPGHVYKAISRSEAPRDTWDSGSISVSNNTFSVRKRMLTGLTYTPMQSNDLKTWKSQAAFTGNGSLVDHAVPISSGNSVFFRWKIEYESFQSFPVP
jgi:murein DD-endopeptidase MepM/ murein hydrolase activator NlpD